MRTACVPSPSAEPATSFDSISPKPPPYPPPAFFHLIPCLARHTNNFDFASDAWASIMFSCSGCGKRSSSFFSPEKPPMYPNKRTPAPQTPSAASARTPSAAAAAARTPSAAAAARTPSAWRPLQFTPLAHALGEDSPRTRARSMMQCASFAPPSSSSSSSGGGGGGGSALQSQVKPHSDAVPPVYNSPFAAPDSAAGPAASSFVSPAAAAAAAAAISLRRSPRLATPTSSHPASAPARGPAKTLGRAEDARHSRIVKMVVGAGFFCVCVCVRV